MEKGSLLTFRACHERPLQALVSADLDGAVGGLAQGRGRDPGGAHEGTEEGPESLKTLQQPHAESHGHTSASPPVTELHRDGFLQINTIQRKWSVSKYMWV